MTGPLWARWVFALLCVVAGVHCALRLARSSSLARSRTVCADRPSDLSHLVMAVGMAVMFAPAPTPVPPSWWAAGFGLLSGWLALDTFRVAGRGGEHGATVARRLAQLVASVAMAGMFAVLGPDGLSGASESHAGHLSASSPMLAVLGWVSVVFFVGQVLVCGARLALPSGAAAVPSGDALARPDTELSVRLLMGLGMSYMLLTML